jgi:DNA-binding MarR family transcriptional regulator
VFDDDKVGSLHTSTQSSEGRADTLAQQIIERTHELRELVGIALEATTMARNETATVTPAHLARLLLRERRDRDLVLETAMLGDPAWDMVLDLFVAGEDGKSVPVSSVCYTAGVSSTTALRWLTVLAEKNVIVRTDDAHDKRRVNASLTSTTRASIRDYLERTAARRGITLRTVT